MISSRVSKPCLWKKNGRPRSRPFGQNVLTVAAAAPTKSSYAPVPVAPYTPTGRDTTHLFRNKSGQRNGGQRKKPVWRKTSIRLFGRNPQTSPGRINTLPDAICLKTYQLLHEATPPALMVGGVVFRRETVNESFTLHYREYKHVNSPFSLSILRIVSAF